MQKKFKKLITVTISSLHISQHMTADLVDQEQQSCSLWDGT